MPGEIRAYLGSPQSQKVTFGKTRVNDSLRNAIRRRPANRRSSAYIIPHTPTNYDTTRYFFTVIGRN